MDLSKYHRALQGAPSVQSHGTLVEAVGLTIKATVPGVRTGELCCIEGESASVLAEVVGFGGGLASLMPLGDLAGIGPGSRVVGLHQRLHVQVGEALLGRILDGLGNPIDGRAPAPRLVAWPVDNPCPNPLTRLPIAKPMATGIRAIDGLLTMGEGQRLGLFAGSGVGKSTLLGQIARNAAAEVVVVGLIGERGREGQEFIAESLGDAGLRRSVVICATSDKPPMTRLKAGSVATAIAEYFRECGAKVLFIMDSVTRLARAQREVGLAIGEPPARQGYPPSVFAMLPRLLERAGNSQRGTCTAIYACLVAGGDMEEPIADEVRGILDGHVVLDRALGLRNHWPAIDILASVSRVMERVTSAEHQEDAAFLRALVSSYEANRDLITLGAYTRGSDARIDRALDAREAISQFLLQRSREATPMEETVRQLARIAAREISSAGPAR